VGLLKYEQIKNLGPTQPPLVAEDGMARTIKKIPSEIHLLIITRQGYLNKASDPRVHKDMQETHAEAAKVIDKIIEIVEEHLAN
jgi:hypothetical protein